MNRSTKWIIATCIFTLYFTGISATMAEGSGGTGWFGTLSSKAQDSIVWSADIEDGSLYKWTFDDYKYSGVVSLIRSMKM